MVHLRSKPAHFARWPLRFFPALLLVTTCQPREPARYDAEYLFVDHLESAVAIEASEPPPSAPYYNIGFDARRALFQHPPSAYRFPGVPSGPGARLVTAPAMNPAAWDQPTNGAGFEASCSAPDGTWTLLLQLEISPADRPADRVWHDRDVSLEPCSHPTTEIELRTTCGPYGNCAADWAAWGHPKVIYPEILAPRPRRLAVLISIDTLRPDRLGLYGAERETSAELERLARDAIVFETAVATTPWTIPSHASMLTSTYPRVHGADLSTPVSEAATSLAEALGAAGWNTAGFVDTPFLSREFGFHRGFTHFDDEAAPQGDYLRGAKLMMQRLLRWLERADERPAFVFWHIMDVHGPYWASSPFGGKFRAGLSRDRQDSRLEQLKKFAYHDYLMLDQYSSLDDLIAAYDEGIAEVDSTIGGLLQILRDADLYDDALIVVTSDHGESFLDHDVWVGHGLFLTDDEVRIPLIVKLPQNRHAGMRVEEMVGLTDVAPTILDALGEKPPDSFQGRSLISPAPGEPASLPAVVYGYSNNTGASSLRTQRVKYISSMRIERSFLLSEHLRMTGDAAPSLDDLIGEQLYRLQSDPKESESLIGRESPAGLATLRDQLARHVASSLEKRRNSPRPPTPELSPEDEERLRALGYLQ